MAKPLTEGELAPRRKREQLLATLHQQKASCSQRAAEAALRAWAFISKKHKKAAMVWSYEDLVVSYHRPHGKKDLDKGAVAQIILAIEEVEVRLAAEEKGEPS